MIPKETIDKINDEARIEEVVGDFITLKKKGANLLGVCPFHNEKTPSFTVSPAKGIYKCFGCGEAGNSVNFLMQLEQLSYPEALRQLAKKYSIEIIEDKLTDEQQQANNHREQLFLVTQFANDYFSNNLLKSEEGKLIGYSYFKERGISDEMIERFSLGYSLEQRNAFSRQAVEKGYQASLLTDTGMSIQKDGRDPFDRFAGRVMFPIQNLSGRVLGFGGRTLSSEKKIAKYLNSPETEIYSKSKVLYGLYQSKRKVIQQDNCFLVEGYTDVISFHQKGIENVVASSGTSLTEDQIKLIRRFTSNITVLFDGDAAGIKASFRGIDMLLKEDMNVKVVSFPDGEDPDSFARKHSTFDIEHFLKDNSKDFISFKCSILLEDAGEDPFKKAELIKDVVKSVSLISDNIIRSVYLKEASRLLNIEESTLVSELNSLRNKKKSVPFSSQRENTVPDFPSPVESNSMGDSEMNPDDGYSKSEAPKSIQEDSNVESEIIRIMLVYGHLPLFFKVPKNDAEGDENSSKVEVTADEKIEEDQEEEVEVSVAEYIIQDLKEDKIEFLDELLNVIYQEFVSHIERDEIPTEKYFLGINNSKVVSKVIELTSRKYLLSENWKRHLIFVNEEEDQLKLAITVICNRLKLERIQLEINKIQRSIKALGISGIPKDEDIQRLTQLLAVKQIISKYLGRI